MDSYYDSEDSDPDAWFEREQEEKFEKVDEVQRHLPSGWAIREVSGNHRKPCSDCGHSSWFPGEFYIYDAAQPWGTDKYCLDCAEMKFLYGGDSEEEDEELAEGDRAREIEPDMEELGLSRPDAFKERMSLNAVFPFVFRFVFRFVVRGVILVVLVVAF